MLAKHRTRVQLPSPALQCDTLTDMRHKHAKEEHSVIDAIRAVEDADFFIVPPPVIPRQPTQPPWDTETPDSDEPPTRPQPIITDAVRPTGIALLEARRNLPIFTKLARAMGWRGILPPPKPQPLNMNQALDLIKEQADESLNMIAKQCFEIDTERARREDAYDAFEETLRKRKLPKI